MAVEVKTGDSYQPLDLLARYSLATADFLAGGGDGYSAFKEAGKYSNSGFVDYEVLEQYIRPIPP